MTRRIQEPTPRPPPHLLPTAAYPSPPNLPSSSSSNHGPKHHEVPAAHGHAFHVKKGTRFRIVDTHGLQVVDMVAWLHPSPRQKHDPTLQTRLLTTAKTRDRYTAEWLQQRAYQQLHQPLDLRNPPSLAFQPPVTTTHGTPLVLPTEYLSMSNTRYHLRGVHPTLGESLYTNASRPLLRLVADTVKTHDMTFMCCHPAFYTERGLEGHRSCAANIAEAVNALKGVSVAGTGMSHLQVPDPFNTFQNTPNYTLKALGSSRAGDFVEWEVLEDALVGVSSCPFEEDGFNGGKATSITVITDITSSE